MSLTIPINGTRHVISYRHRSHWGYTFYQTTDGLYRRPTFMFSWMHRSVKSVAWAKRVQVATAALAALVTARKARSTDETKLVRQFLWTRQSAVVHQFTAVLRHYVYVLTADDLATPQAVLLCLRHRCFPTSNCCCSLNVFVQASWLPSCKTCKPWQRLRNILDDLNLLTWRITHAV